MVTDIPVTPVFQCSPEVSIDIGMKMMTSS